MTFIHWNCHNNCHNWNKAKKSNESDNDQLLYSINLPNDDKITNWYPVFCQSNSNGHIQVVPY